MNIDDKKIALFKEIYQRCQVNFMNMTTDWGIFQIDVLKEEMVNNPDKYANILNTDEDISDFAKQSFLEGVKTIFENEYSKEAAVQSAKKILRNG